MNVEEFEQIAPWEWPENAKDVFCDALRNLEASESDRILAAELGGDLVVLDDELAEALMSIAANSQEPEALRAQAAISLGAALELCDMEGFEDPEEVPISEGTFEQLRKSLHGIYTDAGNPKLVRRRVLEAAVRAPQPWHQAAVRAAHISGDDEWQLTSVFCMRFIKGFDQQILKSLDHPDLMTHVHAVEAAGNWEIESAWPHVKRLLTAEGTEKDLLIAAMLSSVTLCSEEASSLIGEYADSDDEDIAETANETMMMADMLSGDDELGGLEMVNDEGEL